MVSAKIEKKKYLKYEGMIEMEVKWVSGDGGPHILMERKYLNFWTAQKETLYEIACQIDDYIGNLQLPGISLIVISEEMTHTAWIAGEGGREGVVIGLNYMDEEFDEEILIENVRKIPNDEYNETEVEYKIFDDELYLFPACDVEVGGYYNYDKVHLIPGIYKVKIIEEYILYNASFILYKFIKL